MDDTLSIRPGLRARAINPGKPHRGPIRGVTMALLHTLRIPSGVLAKL